MKTWNNLAALVYALVMAISIVIFAGDAEAAPNNDPCAGEWNGLLDALSQVQSAQTAYQNAHADWMNCEYSGGNCTSEWNAALQASTDLQNAEAVYQEAHSDWMACEQGGA